MVNLEQASFWDQHRANRVFWDKETLANTGEVITIQSVEYRPDGRFGSEWIVEATDDAEEVGILSFTDTTARHVFFSSLQAHVETSGPIPAVVKAIQTRAGNTAYILGEP